MWKNKKVLAIFIALIMVCIVVQVIDPISAANTKKTTVDKGIAPLKNSNIIKMHWEVYDYSNKKLKIYTYYTKNNTKIKYRYSKITIKKQAKNKLTINRIYISGNTPNSTKIIKTKLAPRNYYLKTYKNKLLKNAKLKKKLDSGSEPLSNIPHSYITWKSSVYYNKKVSIFENFPHFDDESNKTTIIEKYGKNKLKITTKTIRKSSLKGSNVMYALEGPYKSKTVTYIKTKLSPKDYYFKIYKPKMLKHISKNHEFEMEGGLLKNSKTNLYWVVTSHINKNFVRDKISIVRSFKLHGSTYDKTIISKYNNNKLKITYEINGTKEISYVNTKLSPEDYYYNVYREKLLEIINKSTIYRIKIVG